METIFIFIRLLSNFAKPSLMPGLMTVYTANLYPRHCSVTESNVLTVTLLSFRQIELSKSDTSKTLFKQLFNLPYYLPRLKVRQCTASSQLAKTASRLNWSLLPVCLYDTAEQCHIVKSTLCSLRKLLSCL